MRLQTLKAKNPGGGVLEIPIGVPVGGLFISDVEGLDPVKAQLSTSSYGSRDGEAFTGSRRLSRNILISIRFDPDYVNESPDTLRRELYKYFMPKETVTLYFQGMENGVNKELHIEGIIETLESDLFTKEPSAYISVMCYDVDFLEPEVTVNLGGSIGSPEGTYTVNYDGTALAGFKMSIKMKKAFTQNQLFYFEKHTDYLSQKQQAAVDGPLSIDDLLHIDSNLGIKTFKMQDGGAGTSFNRLSRYQIQSAWFTLFPGANYFVFTPGDANLISLTYSPRYGGL